MEEHYVEGATLGDGDGTGDSVGIVGLVGATEAVILGGNVVGSGVGSGVGAMVVGAILGETLGSVSSTWIGSASSPPM